MIGLPIHLKNPPLAIMANQEIRLPAPTLLLGSDASQAVGKEQDAKGVKCPGNSHLGLRAKAEVVPKARGLSTRCLIVNLDTAGNRSELLPPVLVDGHE